MKWRAANPSLSDGAGLCLCNVLEADRTGKVYPDGLDPDVKIEGPEVRPSEDLDEAIRAAKAWLLEQSQMPSNIDARLQSILGELIATGPARSRSPAPYPATDPSPIAVCFVWPQAP